MSLACSCHKPSFPPCPGPRSGQTISDRSGAAPSEDWSRGMPFDFGLRKANVVVADPARAQSEATVRRTQFEVAVASVDAYLTLVAAQDTIRSAQAGADRAEVVLKTITALVNA